MRFFQLALLICALSFPPHLLAWGEEGHELVASLAERQLKPHAQRELARLLAVEPGATLASISTWADEHRSPATARWHFVNLPRGECRYEPSRDCKDGQCIVAAIRAQRNVLVSSVDDATRLKALKYLVHLVADVHQPLHAGYADDKGGNKYQLQAYGRGTNLHSLWDSGLIRQRQGGAPALFDELSRVPAPSDVRFAPELWAEESCTQVARSGFYPAGRKIGEEYGRQHEAALRERLVHAAARLADVLNEVLR